MSDLKLIDILRYTRKHESVTEALFINTYLIPTIGDLGYVAELDGAGNIWVEAGSKKDFPFLFVAHIDTCHQKEGMIEPEVVGGNTYKLAAADVGKGCLGADDGVGIHCNLRMLEAGVQGTYLFTRGEEKGGIGAMWIAANAQEKLQGFIMSIEVDRAGTDEIIASQSYGECASESFCNELGLAIGMGQTASHQGVYTDVSEFANIIPENVNIAAGYERQHTYKETVNFVYVESLVKRLIEVDYSLLKIKRTPGDYGDVVNQTGWWNYKQGDYDYDYNETDYDRLIAYATKYPERVANYLECCGIEEYEMDREWDRVLDVGPADNDETLLVGMN